MIRETDFLLTAVLLLPELALVVAVGAAIARAWPRPRGRFTDAEVRRLLRISTDRAARFRSN